MGYSPRYHLLAVICMLSACAATQEASVREDGPTKKISPRKHREHVMQSAWRGQPYVALLKNFGPPRTVMAYPNMQTERGEIVLYGVRDANSNCIDAFTVAAPKSNHDRVVTDYFCR
ncbi:hypothetical protein [Noviherbaspirillum sp. ST9]|uniref:hypothetical protein n=1 Tax=Noviherbaspirillum sp. ST9 TaxID=3401606 RepID=UPI003B587594